MACSPAFDIAEGTVKGEPFHTQVVRIDSTDAALPSANQRLPHSSVMQKLPRKTMLEMASKALGDRSSVRLTKLPAALLTRPSSAPPSAQMASSISVICVSWRMSQVLGITRPPCRCISSAAVSSSTGARRPQMYTSAPSSSSASLITRPRPLPPPVTR